MSNLDVALRLRLVDNLSPGAKKASAALQGIGAAAGRMDNGRGGRGLAQSIATVTPAAQKARRDVSDLSAAARGLSANHARPMQKGLEDLSRAAQRAKTDVSGLRSVGTDVDISGKAFSFLNSTASRAFGALMAFAAPAAIVRGLSEIEERVTALDRKYASIAVTAEMRDPAVVAMLRQQDTEVGLRYGMTPDKVQPLRGAFVASGMTLEQAQRLSDPSARAIKAMDTSPENISQAVISGSQNLKIKDQDIPLFLDMMAKGTKLGRFEADSVAKFLPQFSAAYEGMKYTGLPAAAEINAMAQVVRMGSSTPDAAGTNLQNLYAKVFAPDARKNFKEKGIDLERVERQARKEGRSYVRAVLDEVDKATEGGNPFRVSELFGDMQVLDALRAVLPRRDLIDQWKNTILNESAGTVAEDWNFLKTTPAERQAVLDAVTEEGKAKAGQQFEPMTEGWKGMWAAFWNPQRYREIMAPGQNAKHLQYLDQQDAKLGWSPYDINLRRENQKARQRTMWERIDNGWGLDPLPDNLGGLTSFAPGAPMKADAASVGTASGKSYREALSGELKAAEDEVSRAVQNMMQMLSFTARPVISPQIQTPGAATGAPRVEPMSLTPSLGGSEGGSGGGSSAPVIRPPRQRDASATRVHVAQTVHVHGVQDAESLARQLRRAEDRAVRSARNRALFDTGDVA